MAPPRAPRQTDRRGVAVIVCTCDRPERLREFLRSLAGQEPRPAQVMVVDASRGDETERLLFDPHAVEGLAGTVEYFRLPAGMRGLTRQRNFGLRHVITDLVAFFDDDIVLLPGCLREMERVHRMPGGRVAGVAARIAGQEGRPTLLWRVRRGLRIVSTLRPGIYTRSGMSTPWWSAQSPNDLSPKPSNDLVEGDWLPGGATMWQTSIARDVGFNEAFDGYGQGEDLEFCLRLRGRGRLLLAPSARVIHRRDETNRPNPYAWGYMEIRNRYRIHRHALTPRSRRDAAWFFYAWILDTMLLARDLVRPGRSAAATRRIAGRAAAIYEILRWRPA